MTTEESTGSLWSALLEARRASQGVKKSGRNQAQGWSFVTVEDVTREGLRCLNEAGLVAVLCTNPPTDNLTQLDAWLHVVHAETGETIRLPITWPVARQNDQGLRAAYSYARKQALVELLMIAEPDDPETMVGVVSPPHASPLDIPAPPPKPPVRKPHVSDDQIRKIWTLLGHLEKQRGTKLDDTARHEYIAKLAGIGTLQSVRDLTRMQASQVLDKLQSQITPPLDEQEQDG